MRGKTWLLLLLTFLSVSLLFTSCQEEATPTPIPEPADTGIGSVIDLEDAPCGNAYVDDVEIEQTEDGEYLAIVTGNYPSACDQLGKVEQTVDGDTVQITMCSVRPPGIMCAQQLTPFVETIPIDTEGLEPGTYTVDVNGATAELTIQ